MKAATQMARRIRGRGENWPPGASQALRHDALAAQPAGVAVDDVAAVLEVLDEPQPRGGLL
jgi:hypothetical protein